MLCFLIGREGTATLVLLPDLSLIMSSQKEEDTAPQLRKILRWISYDDWNSSVFSVTSTSVEKKIAAAAVAFQGRNVKRSGSRPISCHPPFWWLWKWEEPWHWAREPLVSILGPQGTWMFNINIIYIFKATLEVRQTTRGTDVCGVREGEKSTGGYTLRTDERLEEN